MKTLWGVLTLSVAISAPAAAEDGDLRERDADLVAAVKSEPNSAIRYLRQRYPADSEVGRMVDLLATVGHPFRFSGTALDGRVVDSREFAGRVILLDVWFRDCGGCQAQAPALLRLAAKYQSQGLVVVSLSIDSDSARAKAFVDRFGIPWPVLFDGRGVQGKLARDLFVSYAPRGVLFDRRGNLRMLECFGRKQSLEASIKMLLAEEPNQHLRATEHPPE
jgi:thiol-disulfide isomerase/thioredoxin